MEIDPTMVAPINIESEDYDSMYEVWTGGNFRIVLTNDYASNNEVTVKVVTLNRKTQEYMKSHGLRV